MKIFIVEDEIWYAEVLAYHLGLNPDHETKVLSTGKEALQQLSANPDVLVIDLSLPDMDGFELIKTIQSKILQIKRLH